MMENHVLMDGKLHVYRRSGSRFWQCSAYLDGRNHRATTREENLVLAKEFATYWYMEQYVASRRHRLANSWMFATASQGESSPSKDTPKTAATRSGKTFREAAEKFFGEYEIITEGQRSESYVNSHKMRLRLHLLPFFGDKLVSEINAGLVQEYRVHRRQAAMDAEQPATTDQQKINTGRRAIRRSKGASRSTLHHETVTLRLVLNTAQRHGWIEQVPDISPPYKTSGKITHRAWFSVEEYRTLYQATRERAKEPEEGALAHGLRRPARLRPVYGEHRSAAR